jgi:hypothetical protein
MKYMDVEAVVAYFKILQEKFLSVSRFLGWDLKTVPYKYKSDVAIR